MVRAGRPYDDAAAASCPADRVTWRTSSGRPKKALKAGTSPSMKPSEMLDAKPEMLCRMKCAQRSARAVPSRPVMRGL